jgi:hypothetical protein
LLVWCHSPLTGISTQPLHVQQLQHASPRLCPAGMLAESLAEDAAAAPNVLLVVRSCKQPGHVACAVA